jgi:hypothetical protein
LAHHVYRQSKPERFIKKQVNNMEKAKKLVLQVGESTHTHVLESSETFEHETIGSNAIHLVLDGVGVLRHEEHGAMVFMPGNYFKFPQSEYDPFKRIIREVYD